LYFPGPDCTAIDQYAAAAPDATTPITGPSDFSAYLERFMANHAEMHLEPTEGVPKRSEDGNAEHCFGSFRTACTFSDDA